MEPSEPPVEAYGRVTNPARFQVLWSAADEIIERLVHDFLLECADEDDVPDRLGLDAAGGRKKWVRLTPRSTTAGSLTVAFTGFPGLVVRFGRWHEDLFPVCGCDACHDDPEDLVDRLTEQVADLVSGRFSERWRLLPTPRLEYQFSTSSGATRLRLRDVTRYGRPTTIAWGPWPVREAKE